MRPEKRYSLIFKDTDPAVTLHRITLNETYDALLARVAAVGAAIHRDGPAYQKALFFPHDVSESAEAALTRAVTDIRYTRQKADGENPIYPALVSASPDTLAAVTKANTAKKAFKTCLVDLDRMGLQEADDRIVSLGQALLDRILKRKDKTSLHRLEAYRKFRVVQTPVNYVGFFWGISNTSTRLGRDQALVKLAQRLGTDEEAARYLAEVAPNEQLVWQTKSGYTPRVNMEVSDQPAQRGKNLLAVLPVFIPGTPGGSLPVLTPLKDRPEGPQRRRRPSKLATPPLYEDATRRQALYRYDPPRYVTTGS
jgi:hypothetical protein